MKRLINFILPVQACNFKCHYCYIGQENRFKGTLGCLSYPPEHIQKAMTVERLGGICHINVCGLGETLLPDYSIDLIRRMLENGHFVTIVTNGTLRKQIEEILSFDCELLSHLFFKFSFHYLELERTGLLKEFFENVRLVQDSNISFTVELTVNDECVPRIDNIQSICREELGAMCHVIESRDNNEGFARLTKLDVNEHIKSWDRFESDLFEFQKKHWMKRRKEFCYAGDWVVSLNVESGWMMPCFAGGKAIQNIFENIEEPIHFQAIGCNCQWKHCYAAYVLLTSGVIPELDTPSYYIVRNRVNDVGTSWVKGSVCDFFQKKLCDDNIEYSEKKKKWLNIINKIIYDNEFPEEDNLEELFSDIRINDTIAILGKGEREQWLYRLLKANHVKCRFLLLINDMDGSNTLKHRVKYHVKHLVEMMRPNSLCVLNQYDNLPAVDYIVYCDSIFLDSNKVEQMLSIPLKCWNELILGRTYLYCCKRRFPWKNIYIFHLMML